MHQGCNNVTYRVLDALDRIVSIEDPDDGTIAYTYDARDNVAAVTDPRNLTTTYTYDGLDNRVEQVSPDSGITIYTHDAAGNVITRTDARAVTTTYSYDALNRVISIDYPDDTLDVTFVYDYCPNGIGRLCTMTDGSGSTSYEYDPRGNLVAKIVVVGDITRTIGYGYDIADRRIAVTYPSGRIVSYHRNAIGQITQVITTSPDGTSTELLADNLSYAPFGPMTDMVYGNGIELERGFDQDYRLTNQAAGDAQQLAYLYDPANNITELSDGVDPVRNQAFSYDALDRLADATGSYGTLGYAYDAVGNRLSLTENGQTETNGYAPDSNRLITVENGTMRAYTYDANGNTIDDGEYGFTYSDHNRLTEANAGGSSIARYTYNGIGERVIKETDSTTLYFYDEAGNLLAETDAQGNTLKSYIYLANVPLAVVDAGDAGAGGEIDKTIDNEDSGVAFHGSWVSSTVVPGFAGSDYRHHAANGPSPDGIVVDNADGGFSATGSWGSSTAVGGYVGIDYLVHEANGPSPDALTIDNGDAGFSATGSWNSSTAIGGYLGSDYLANDAGTGSDTATWTLTVTDAGDYAFAARWTAAGNRASDAAYTVTYAGGSETFLVNQQQNGGAFQTLATLSLQPGTVTVNLSNDANGYIIADAVSLLPTTAEPSTATWTFQVPETGDYDVQARWTSHPNRASNAIYSIMHVAGAADVIVNQVHGGGQFQTLGRFSFEAGQTYAVSLTDEADGYVIADAIQVVADAGGPNRVVWQPDVDGEVEVFARWSSNPNRATNAPYTVNHANGSDTVLINQQQQGGTYVSLGTYTLETASTIVLTDQADGFVIADAIRLVGTSQGAPQTAPDLYFVHSNHLGTPVKLTDSDQAIVWDAVYRPFGKANIETASITYNQRFPGQYYDEETGLYYNYFRTLDPATGRYLESDPVGLAGGLNTYGYVDGNPLSRVDPHGLFGVAGLNQGRLGEYRRNGGQLPNSTLNVEGSVGAFGHGAVVGLGVNAGASFKDGKGCVFVELCGSWGLGVFGTAGGQVGGGIDFGGGYARSGYSIHTGAFYGGGAGGSAMYSVMAEEQNPNASVNATGTVRGGIGGGGAAGFISCRRLTWCPNPAALQCSPSNFQ